MRKDAALPHRPGAAVSLALIPLAVLLSTGCGERRPEFSIDLARERLAAAFDRDPSEVAIYDDYDGSDDDVAWIVELKLDGYDPFLQARFVGEAGGWSLDGVRERGSGGEGRPWQDVGVIVGRVRGEVAAQVEESEARIEELASLVEQYAVDHANTYPVVGDMSALRSLIVGGGYTKSWRYDTDAFGNALLYHAAPDGYSYIIVSAGADGEWDLPPSTYFRNTDEGMEAYEGIVSDPARDIIWATGAFAQRYRPPL